jgi:SAM-dependent methyltransferase
MHEHVRICRCCGGGDLVPYLDLGEQPLANAYHRGEALPRFPLAVSLCRGCAHSQLGIVVDPELLFRHYLYVSGTTETFRRHTAELADDALAFTGARRVLDVACNDGTLLEQFRARGCEVHGVDPALNLRELTVGKGLPVLTELWGAQAASELRASGAAPFDLITATNVLAHVADPLEFLRACAAALAPGGTALVEFPYGVETVDRCEFDQVYHEHVSYFLARSLTALAERAGFEVRRALRTPIHGGSIRFFLRPTSGAPRHCGEVAALLEHERARGLHDPATYERFSARVQENGRALRVALERARRAGRKVVGYGASAKGNTVLNAFELDLSYVVDDNPLKWSLLTPGRDVPIRPPAALAEETEPLTIVVMAWNFLEEIQRRVLAVRGQRPGDSFLLYVPSVRELPIAGALTSERVA